ncbi:MAG: ABC-type transport auxiliary lipoprotein family protein [Syntrophales bacterium]
MMKRLGIILVVAGLTGCIGSTGAAPPVRQYVLEYAAPRVAVGAGIAETIRVEHFTATRILAGPAMLYRRGPFRLDAYHEHRWRVAPAEMVEDLLRRDRRRAGIFRAVLAPRDAEESRFVLEGGVEEFNEVVAETGRKALLVATFTLLDLSRQEVSARVVFQRTYRAEAPFKTEGAAGFAEAMSSAMAEFSKQAIADIGQAVNRKGN